MMFPPAAPPPLLFSDASNNHASSSSNDILGTIMRVMGLSAFASLFTGSNSNMFDALKLFIMGSVFETGRRICHWALNRFRVRYCITADFDENDPSYEWLINFLTKQGVWRSSKDFSVTSKSSQLRGGVSLSSGQGSAEYVPKYGQPHLFRWRGYWIEVQRGSGSSSGSQFVFGGYPSPTGSDHLRSITLTLYTLNLGVLSSLVDEAHQQYLEGRRPHVIVHLNDSNLGALWNNVKRKNRRPLDSIILPEGILESLVEDVREFMRTEDWYVHAGIPYRRGYLLYGPPGTGKTSTIYALAGELGLEIYTLSLSSGCVDDVVLEKSLSSLPKNSIFLLEDIDCAFLSREDDEEEGRRTPPPFFHKNRGLRVTMSGLLNVLDGVASEDGKIFFATTNYIDRLDPALIRPGRIDKKIEYKLATKSQADALFNRFYPLCHDGEEKIDQKRQKYSTAFAAQIPEDEFTTAELQGYLLPHKKNPDDAVKYLPEWIENERVERKRRKEVEQREREKAIERARRATAKVYGPFSNVQ